MGGGAAGIQMRNGVMHYARHTICRGREEKRMHMGRHVMMTQKHNAWIGVIGRVDGHTPNAE